MREQSVGGLVDLCTVSEQSVGGWVGGLVCAWSENLGFEPSPKLVDSKLGFA